jgi:anthranilate/para-aminobenzoate synthase component I
LNCFGSPPKQYNPPLLPPRINLSSVPEPAPSTNPWPTGFLHPVCTVRCDANAKTKSLRTTAHVGASLLRTWDNPLLALDWISRTFWPDKGRWIGFLSYDLGRLFEHLPDAPPDDLNLPLFAFTYCRPVPDRPGFPEPDYGRSDSPLTSNFTSDQYQSAVARVIDFIRAGDVFQVNLSQRLTVGLREHPSIVYQRLCQQTPALYGAYLAFEDFALICNSPELFLKIDPPDSAGRRRVITRPIKGTRPRDPGMDEHLRQSAKDQAELNMIVDLLRNDLGRVCHIGSVKVESAPTVEAHATVYHGVATIAGALRADVSLVDLLKAVFPGGSITGAPKIRAMQIIDQLEPIRRGPYTGAIGYLDRDGSMQFNIAIRTMIVANAHVHIPIGAGIVADSVPADEYAETLVKARAILAALRIEEPLENPKHSLRAPPRPLR